jgi:dTDP-4-amino-4,6-dideoxygalactose transaminase
MKKQKIIPITRPTLRPFTAYAPSFRDSIASGMLTLNKNVREFEKRTAAYLGVKHCVAVSTCTSGLMLVLKGLGLTGEVILPSFTFSASGHPLMWGGLTPVFADITPDTFEIDPASVEKLITKDTSAILATHVFGVPCDVEKLQAIARKHNLKLLFDAAHAFGSTYKGAHVGTFGDAEVFSCSPTKVLTTAEGGIVATNNDALAEFVRRGRNYGDNGTYIDAFAGLSARMSEFHAAIGLVSLKDISKNLKRRRARAEYFKKQMLRVEPKLRFQTIPAHAETTYKDLSVFIDPKLLGYTRDELNDFFAANGVITRKYFHPPLHAHPAYHQARHGALGVTDTVSTSVLSLPMYSHIEKADIDRVVSLFTQFNHDRKKS